MSSLQLSQLPAITTRAERCPVRGLAGIKPPERSYRRSQLSLRVLGFYEDKRLGMPRAALRPPSKPVHPRNRWWRPKVSARAEKRNYTAIADSNPLGLRLRGDDKLKPRLA